MGNADKPISLYPLSTEQAISALLKVKPPEKPKQEPKAEPAPKTDESLV